MFEKYIVYLLEGYDTKDIISNLSLDLYEEYGKENDPEYLAWKKGGTEREKTNKESNLKNNTIKATTKNKKKTDGENKSDDESKSTSSGLGVAGGTALALAGGYMGLKKYLKKKQEEKQKRN